MTPTSREHSATTPRRSGKPFSVLYGGTVRSARPEREVWWQTLRVRLGGVLLIHPTSQKKLCSQKLVRGLPLTSSHSAFALIRRLHRRWRWRRATPEPPVEDDESDR